MGRLHYFQNLEIELEDLKKKGKRVLVHCSSVGEWEQAVPLIQRIKEKHPDIAIIVTFFSPSGFNFVKSHADVDLKIYLPIDSLNNARRFFRLIQPQLWIISKFDIWPSHLYVAGKMKIPVAITAATLSINSGRNKGLAGFFHRYLYRAIDYIFPISNDDRDRFLKLFPYPNRLSVTGDTRFDQVYFKGEQAKKKGNVTLFSEIKRNSIILIGGSLWPADEKHLLPALGRLLRRHRNLLLIVVPHELHESHIGAIESFFNETGIETERYTNFKNGNGSSCRVVIINTVGLLARIYQQSQIAYVGGSFSSGVHNVMEPAVFSQPVLVGPRHTNSFEAMELMKIGSAFCVNNESEIEEKLEFLITHANERKAAGQQAVNLIKKNLGAADQIIHIMEKRYDFLSKNHSN